VRYSLDLIRVGFQGSGKLIRIQCVVFNFRLTITLRRQPVTYTSRPDFELEPSKTGSDSADDLPHPMSALLIDLARQPELTSHLDLPPPALRRPSGGASSS